MKQTSIDTLIRVVLVVSLIVAFLLQLSSYITPDLFSTLVIFMMGIAQFLNAWREYQKQGEINGSIFLSIAIGVFALGLIIYQNL